MQSVENACVIRTKIVINLIMCMCICMCVYVHLIQKRENRKLIISIIFYIRTIKREIFVIIEYIL